MTTNPRAVADADTMTVRRTIRISAPVEKVWAAVTEPEHISRWFGRTLLAGEGVGAQGTIAWPDQPAMPIRVEEMDPPRSVAYRWWNEGVGSASGSVDAAPSTVFTFTLVPAGDGTELTVVESGFEVTANPSKNLEEHRGGWDDELDKLVDLLEGGAR